MWIDASKAVLVVVTAVDAYFGVLGNVTPFWVPLAILATMFAVYVRIPWWLTAKEKALQEQARQVYLNQVMGRGNDDPKQMN